MYLEIANQDDLEMQESDEREKKTDQPIRTRRVAKASSAKKN